MSWLDRFRKQKPGKSRSAKDKLVSPHRQGSNPPTTLRKPVAGAPPTPPRAPHLSVPRFTPGELIADSYLVKKIIEGGMSTVYITHHLGWNLDLVVKVPHQDLLDDPDNAHRITREAEAWTELGLHPHIAYCYYVHPLDGVPLLVIEYVDGGSLRDWISDGRCAELKQGLDTGIQFCHGLEHAHSRGMIHRDIKPENILMSKEGVVKITDFGIARMREVFEAAASPERVGAMAKAGRSNPMTVGWMGTYAYMAPEQWIDAHDVDERADIFAFGVCLYEMLSGGRPYEIATGERQEAPDPREVRGDDGLPERLCGLMRRCVEWDRERRPTSCAEMRQELCAIYEGLFDQPSVFAILPDLSLKADGLNNRAVSYLHLGREADAIRCWEEALKEDPHHLEATFNLGYLRREKGEIGDDIYVKQIRELEGSMGANPDYWRCLVWIHYERGDTEAVDEIQKSEHKVEDEEFKKALEAANRPQGRLLRVFEGHTSAVWCMGYSADGRYALSGSDDKTLRLWDVESGHEIRHFKGHTNSVHSVSFSPDGRYALSGSSDNTLRLWDVETGKHIRRFVGHTDKVSAVTFSPDGRYALSGSGDTIQSERNDETLRLWHVETGHEIRSFQGHTGAVLSVSYSPDGCFALSGGNGDPTLRLWEVKSGQQIRSFEGHTAGIESVSFSPDGRYALSGSNDTTLQLWDVETGKQINRFKGHTGGVSSVSISADGRYVLSGSYDNTVRLWDLKSGREIRCFDGHDDSVASVSFSSDGRHALSGSWDKTLRLWDLNYPYKEWRAIPPYPLLCRVRDVGELLTERVEITERLRSVRESMRLGHYCEAYLRLRELQRVKGYERDREVMELLTACGTKGRRSGLNAAWQRHLFEGHTNLVNSVSFSPNGRYALSGAGIFDNTVRLWDVESGREIRCFEGHTTGVNSVSFSPDGRYAISGSWNSNLLTSDDDPDVVREAKESLRARFRSDVTLRMWDVESGHEIGRFEGNNSNVQSVVFSPSGRYALSGGDDKTLRLWDVNSGSEIRCFGGHTSKVNSVSFSPDGRYALSGSSDKTLRLWDVESGREIRRFEGHQGNVESVVFSLDGRYALSGSDDKTLRLWDVESGHEIRCFEGHTDSVYSVSFSPDERYAVSGSSDKTLRLWDVETGQQIRRFEGHTSWVRSVRFSPDGRYALSGSLDNSIRLWEFDWEWEF